MESLTPEASKMFGPPTWPDSFNVTSSQASADGLTPFVLPDGRIISPSGLAHALVNLSHRQVKELGRFKARVKPESIQQQLI